MFDCPALTLLQNYIRIIRVLRAFRPLRLIARYEGLRIVLSTIAKSIEPVLSTVAILLVTFSIYGILGVQLFMEKFRTCNDSSISSKSLCVGSYNDASGRLTPREWSSPPLNFDNLANALVCLFILSTQDDWTNFMWQGIDAVSPEEAPVENTNPGTSIPFFMQS
jgi:voltage-dependent calcium channel T type alpha-1G